MKLNKLALIAILIIAVLVSGCIPEAEHHLDDGHGHTKEELGIHDEGDHDDEDHEDEDHKEGEMQVLTIGSVLPLTGDGAVYGVPIQKVYQQAAKEVNEEWKAKNKKLEIVFEDGKCNAKDALTAAQNLVNLKGMKVILGGACSSENLGMAPFLEENKVVILSASATSPELTTAGDYTFRNTPSDVAQVQALSDYIRADTKHQTVALLTENKDYPQALRKGYQEVLESFGIEIVADEIVQPQSKDVRTQMLKIKDANPDALIVLPQAPQLADVVAKQYVESGLEMQVYGSEVTIIQEGVEMYSTQFNGLIAPRPEFDEESNEPFKTLKSQTGCDIGNYCGTAFDGVKLMASILDTCGDKDSECIKNALYATKDYKGVIWGPYTFDEFGDVSGAFELMKISDGELVKVK